MSKLSICGMIPDNVAVVGVLESRDTSLDGRPVLVIMSEGLSDYKRRQSIMLAKQEGYKSLIPLAGKLNDELPRTFSRHAKNDITGKIDNAYNAESTIELIFDETETGLIVLDCRNKSSFWSSLQVMNVPKEDMFAVAELEALKEEPTFTKAKKPIIQAHELCRSLREQKLFKEVGVIRNAVKVKMPSISMLHHNLYASYKRDVAINYNEKISGSGMFWFGRKSAAIVKSIAGLFNKKPPDAVSSILMNAKVAELHIQNKYKLHDKDILKVMFINSNDGTGSSLFPLSLVNSGDVEDQLKKYYKKHYDYDVPNDFSPLMQAHELLYSQAYFRVGDYRMRYDNMLLGTDVYPHEQDRKDNNCLNYFCLLASKGDEISVKVFMGSSLDKPLFFIQEDHSFRIYLDDKGGVESMWQDNNETGKSSLVTIMGDSSVSLVISQTLSTLARMNEPDFVEHVVKPSISGAKSSKKGHYPYFEAIDVSSLGPSYLSRSIGIDGSMTGAVRLHRVIKHPRRIFDKETRELKVVVSIPSHMRGNPENGVKSKSFDLS